jgi:hypothetical protein
MSETVGDKIIEALGVIRERGWCAGIRQNAEGQVCALGALDNVAYRGYRRLVDAWYNEAILALQVNPEDLTEVDEYNGTSVEELRESRRLLNDPQDGFPAAAFYAENVVAGYNNTHTREEVEAWFEKAAMNIGVSNDR